MKYLFAIYSFAFFFAHGVMAQSDTVFLTGTVKDQDGNPVPHAQVSTLMNIGETDEEGRYELNIKEDHLYHYCYYIDVKAEGYPSISSYCIKKNRASELPLIRDFTLFNRVKFQANTLSTIILPVQPAPTLGKYFRLSSMTPLKICFEREHEPQANVPYVLIPEHDFDIDVNDYDITLEPGSCKVVGKDTLTSRPYAQFVGTYFCLDTDDCYERERFFLLDTTPDCFPSENGVGVVVGTFHAYFKLRDMVHNPEIILNDTPNCIASNQCAENVGSMCYNLAGQKIKHSPKKGSLYICNYKKKIVD